MLILKITIRLWHRDEQNILCPVLLGITDHCGEKVTKHFIILKEKNSKIIEREPNFTVWRWEGVVSEVTLN